MMNMTQTQIGELETVKKRVLFVDDERDLTWSIVRRLSRDDHRLEFLCSESGDQALDLMNTHPVHLLVTDLRMPGMSGQDLILRVRSEYPDVKIIMMTAFPSPELKEFIRRFGISGCIEKPFELNDLRHLIYANCLGENHIHEGRFDQSRS
jgi:DNA-binding NtrC family response regulator